MVLQLGQLERSIINAWVSFEMWCWRRMEKIIWTDRVRNVEVLHRVKVERNVLETIKRRKANWIGHTLRRICLLKHVIKGKIEGKIGLTEDDEEDVSSYWKALREREGTGN
jgi:hypothetical protein